MTEAGGFSSSVAAEVLMLRAAGAAPFCLVEGVSDQRFWRSRLEVPPSHVIACGGRPSLFKTLAQLANHGEPRVIGVADRDGEDHLGPLPAVPGVVWTDGWDLEAMLLSRRCLRRLLLELADPERLAAFETERGDFWEALLRLGAQWGAHRVAAKRSATGASVPSIEATLDRETWTVRADSDLVRSPPPALTGPPQRCAHGKDLLTLLSLALDRLLGGVTKREERRLEALQRLVRLAFDDIELLATSTAEEIRAIEGSVEGLVFLRRPRS